MRLSVHYGILPSELDERMTMGDYLQLCTYMSYEPLPSNKIDIMQAVLSYAIANIMSENKLKLEDFFNPWVMQKGPRRELTFEEQVEMQVDFIEQGNLMRVDDNGNALLPEVRRAKIRAKVLERMAEQGLIS